MFECNLRKTLSHLSKSLLFFEECTWHEIKKNVNQMKIFQWQIFAYMLCHELDCTSKQTHTC